MTIETYDLRNTTIPPQSVRSKVVWQRSYARPKNEEGTLVETTDETLDRVISHQQWLWERQLGKSLSTKQHEELKVLRGYMERREAFMSGRTLWLGGTETAMRRESTQFNCAGTDVTSVYDIVDVFWLLLQGSGVGFHLSGGVFWGFQERVESIQVIRSERTKADGNEHNVETYNADTRTWTLQVGDSAEAWTKAIGKLVVHKYPARHIVFDLSQIRPAGLILKGYGWTCSGDNQFAEALRLIALVLNKRTHSLLTKIDLLDILNILGTTLSSRRSAEIALMDYGDSEWKEFATCKQDHEARPWGGMSNNSLMFREQPTIFELANLFQMMLDSGGSEPGFINAIAALSRAPWFGLPNPCGEILLPYKGFCNLAPVNTACFKNRFSDLFEAVRIMGRASYRQTCVNLQDGILQEKWHTNNQELRLCGVSLSGVVDNELSMYDYKCLERIATHGAYSMAEELGTPYPKNVTTIKPDGTIGKVFDSSEGLHRRMGQYMFNNMNFSADHPLVEKLLKAGYHTVSTSNKESVVICIPIENTAPDPYFKNVNGYIVNTQPAVSQMNFYKKMMNSYVQQNASNTIYYSPDEVPNMVKWLDKNWDDYVGMSFLLRSDAITTKENSTWEYIPQEVVKQKEYDDYVKGLKPVDLSQAGGVLNDVIVDDGCASGVCPVR